jgi:hypothetical protein
VAEIRRIFSPSDIRHFLDELEREKYLAPADMEDDIIDDDEGDDEELYLENPVSGANELLRFLRIRQLLTE